MDAIEDDAEVPAFWQALGLPGLIDIHVHFMPEPVLHKVWKYFDWVTELGLNWPIRYRTPDAQRLGTLRALGVRAFSALTYPHKPRMAAWLNEWTAQFAAEVPECLSSATFYPEPGMDGQMRSVVERGVDVVKAHLQVGAYDPRNPLLDPVWGLLAEAGTPVVCHCGSGPQPGPFTGPGPISEVLARHPELTLVVAHMGLPDYADFLDLAARYPNVHLDTTMVFTPFTEAFAPFPADLRSRLRDLGDRIVLGSDFPNIPYPYATQLAGLARLDLDDAWLRAVLWTNPARLLRLPATIST